MFAIALAAVSGAFATPLPLPLDLPEAVRLGLEANPSYRLARTEVEKARGARRAAEPWLPANPVLNADVGPRQANGLGTNPSYQTRLEQRLNLPGQRPARLRAADESISLEERRLDAVAAEVRARVRIAYVTALVARQRVEFSQQQVDFVNRAYEAAKARVESGASSDIEQRVAELEFGAARIALSQALGGNAQARQGLQAVLGLDHDRAVVLTSALASPPFRREARDTLLTLVRERRRDLLALRQEGRSLDAQLEMLRQERLPAVAVALTLEQDSRNEYWFAPGVTVSPPLWQRNQGPLAVTAAERLRQQIDLETREQAAVRELDLAVELSQRRREQIAVFEDSVLPAADRARTLVFEGWRSGKFDIFRLLIAEREFIQAQLRYLENLTDLWSAEIEIDRALGRIEEGEGE